MNKVKAYDKLSSGAMMFGSNRGVPNQSHDNLIMQI